VVKIASPTTALLEEEASAKSSRAVRPSAHRTLASPYASGRASGGPAGRASEDLVPGRGGSPRRGQCPSELVVPPSRFGPSIP
jgi:hypothetical protein